MTLFWISYGLMTVACALSFCTNILLKKAMKKAREALDDQRGELDSLVAANREAIGFRLNLSRSELMPAEIREDMALPIFVVERKYGDAKIVCKKIFYNPDDPDDRDYKRIHAEEVAEMLNEEP